jgi:hypothetical protein
MQWQQQLGCVKACSGLHGTEMEQYWFVLGIKIKAFYPDIVIYE